MRERDFESSNAKCGLIERERKKWNSIETFKKNKLAFDFHVFPSLLILFNNPFKLCLIEIKKSPFEWL